MAKTVKLPEGHLWLEVPDVPMAFGWSCERCGAWFASPLDDPHDTVYEEGDGTCDEEE